MTEFHPSGLSRKNCGDYGIADAVVGLIGAGISVAESAATTGVGLYSSKKGQERQQAHEKALTEQQAALAIRQQKAETALRREALAAETETARALESLRAKKTLVLGGFALAGLVIAAGTVILVSRTGSSGSSYEDEEEYE